MKSAVVTGAGRGLGAEIARGLADKGYTVLITDIDEAAAADSARRIGRGALSMHQDVRDPDSHREVARAACEQAPLGVWVNNAGVLAAGNSWEVPEDAVRRQVEVNLLGVVWGCHAAIAAMDSGHIINIASLSSLVPAPGLAVYSATKHAVLGYSVALEGELDHAGRDIEISAVCPDAIETDLVRGVADQEASDILFSSGTLLTPEKVAEMTVALLDHPRLVTVIPRYRGVLAHLVRPFPAVGLKVLDQFRKVGSRNRRRRGE